MMPSGITLVFVSAIIMLMAQIDIVQTERTEFTRSMEGVPLLRDSNGNLITPSMTERTKMTNASSVPIQDTFKPKDREQQKQMATAQTRAYLKSKFKTELNVTEEFFTRRDKATTSEKPETNDHVDGTPPSATNSGDKLGFTYIIIAIMILSVCALFEYSLVLTAIFTLP